MAEQNEAKTSESMRLDKWLVYARFVKTRSQAQGLISAGHIRINREKISNTSRKIRIGDVITLARPRSVQIIAIKAFAERRGSASIAQTLYDDLTPKPDIEKDKQPKSSAKQSQKLDAEPLDVTKLPAPTREKGMGRPTKRDRRALDQWHKDRQ